MKKKWKKRALAALLAALTVLSAACGADPDDEQEPVDNVQVSDAYFGLAWYQNGTLNPVLDSTDINRVLCEALYEGLFEVTSDFTAENVLCESYEGDGTTFTFTLLEGVTFWSGAPLTADDVAASLQTAQQDESSPYHSRLTEVSSIRAVGDRTVRIELSSPNVDFPRLLDIPIYREGSADSGSFADGTGPYRPVEGDNGWTLEANEDWHGGFLGSIRHITLVELTRADTALSSFQTGEVSLMRAARIDPDPPNVGGSVDTVQTASASLHYLGFNYDNPQLANAGVRRALSAALSRTSLCETQLQTFADPAVLPVNPQPDDSSLSLNLSADPNGAAQLLREALQADGSGDGDTADEGYYDEETGEYVEPDASDEGASLSGVGTEAETVLSFRLLVNSDNAFKAAAADQIAASWNALDGVQVTVEKQPYETFLSMLQSGDFDVYYGETQLTADFDLRPLLAEGGSLNYGGCASETMSAAIAAQRSGGSTADFYRTFLDEMPIVPVAFERGQIIIRKGLIDNYQPAPYNAFAGQETWTSLT